ncbi:Prolyl tripeptidyl peptidase precursor [Phycisphaerae bacterium RAS1]|nr:Prolyl tripeptidyl peptidase precursor [Phycisphaerae bacterium RAS1]
MTLRSRVSSMFVIAIVSLASAAEPTSRQVGQVVLEGVPAWGDAIRERMLQYINVRSAGLQSIAAGGKSVLITTRFGSTAQLHVVDMPLGMRRQISFFDEPIGRAFFIPGCGKSEIGFSKDVGGNEMSQFYVLDQQDGRHRLITDGKSRNDSPIVSKNGRWAAWSSTRRNGRDFDIYVSDLTIYYSISAPAAPEVVGPETDVEAASRKSGQTAAADSESRTFDMRAKLALQVEGSWYPREFSPDEAKILVEKYVSEKQSEFHVLDVASGQSAPLTPPTPPAFYGGGAWAPDGKALYFFSDKEGEFRKLYRLDFEYGTWKSITADIEWDVEEVAADPAGKGIAFIVNEDGVSKLYFADPWGNGRKTVDGLPKGVIGGLDFAEDGGVVGFTLNCSTSPADVYTATFPDGKLTRWTESEVGGLNRETFIDAELIRYPTFDQVDGKPRKISAFYYKARGAGPHAVVICPHGGPESQYTPTFSPSFQYWTSELGISVIAPNVRGSTGYGRSFHQLDNAVKREDSVKDIGALLDWIEKQPELDAKRVGIYGGSYGGYMVLASLVNYPKRFKAGVDYVGVADFITFLKNTAEYRRDLRREEYGDERVPEVRAVLEQISPLRRADKIEAALFVVHGANDPRVPLSEAQQIVAKMRAMGRPVWSCNALNEGHGFRKKENSDLLSVLLAHFWQEHLLE